MKFDFDFNTEKNLLLKETRGISFEDIVQAVRDGKTLADTKHHNQKTHPNQRILIVKMDDYVYAVPYVIDKKRKVLFLKTLYPSKILTKKYL